MSPIFSGYVAGGVIGATTGVSYFLSDVLLTGSTRVPLENAVAVGVFCAGMVWWSARRFQRIDDNFERVQPLVEKTGELVTIGIRLKAIEDKCGKVCPAQIEGGDPHVIKLAMANNAILHRLDERLKRIEKGEPQVPL